MKREVVFVDTNIILDWLGGRVPYFEKAIRKGENPKSAGRNSIHHKSLHEW
jgi:hypothetical protein